MAEKKSLLAELDKEAKAPRKTEAEIGALDDTLYHLHKEIEVTSLSIVSMVTIPGDGCNVAFSNHCE